MSKPLIIAHRGCSFLAPENTLGAFQLAIDLNCSLIELDIRLSKEHIPFVIHDASLMRTSSCHFPFLLSMCSSRYIKTLDAGSWFHPNFSFETIPLLEEVLCLNRKKTGLFIEMKGHFWMAKKYVTIVLDLLNKHQTQDNSSIFLGSQSLLIMKKLKKACPQSLVAITGKKSNIKKILALHPPIIALEQTLISSDLMEQLKKMKIDVWVWTVDNPFVAKQFHTAGVKGFVSNKPDKLMEIFKN